jgi:hypothetical protein
VLTKRSLLIFINVLILNSCVGKDTEDIKRKAESNIVLSSSNTSVLLSSVNGSQIAQLVSERPEVIEAKSLIQRIYDEFVRLDVLSTNENKLQEKNLINKIIQEKNIGVECSVDVLQKALEETKSYASGVRKEMLEKVIDKILEHHLKRAFRNNIRPLSKQNSKKEDIIKERKKIERIIN